MKIGKKLLSIVLIFLVIQTISVLFCTNRANAGFFDDVFNGGSKWKKMGERGAQNIVDNATELTNTTDSIYNGVRALGVGIFMVNIAFTAITLSSKNNGKDIAGAKLTIAFTFILALLFIFAKDIMNFFTNDAGDGIFDKFENLMQ